MLDTSAVIDKFTKTTSVIDKGFSFSLRRAGSLILLAFFPTLVELFNVYFASTNPLSDKASVLLFVTQVIAKAWLLMSVCAFMVSHFKKETANPFLVSFYSLVALPKTLFSYGVVLAIFIITILPILTLPFIYYVIPFVWAPIFCALETYSKSYMKEKFEDPDAEYDESDEEQRRGFYFADKFLWELGLSRSTNFTLLNRAVTYKLALFVFFVSFVPAAVIGALMGNSFGFSTQLLQISVSSFCEVLALSTMVFCFFELVPDAALKEVNLDKSVSADVPAPAFSVVLGRRGTLLFFLIFLVSLYYSLTRALKIPEEIDLNVQAVETEKETLRLKVVVTDTNRYLSWFDAKDLVIKIKSQDVQNPIELKPTLLSATDLVRGTQFSIDHYTPSKNPLVLNLSFRGQELPQHGSYELFYSHRVLDFEAIKSVEPTSADFYTTQHIKVAEGVFGQGAQ